MYDAVIILGLKISKDWQIADDLKQRLDYAADMHAHGETKLIILSGKWSIWFDWLHIVPPITEAKAMQNYLQAKGVSMNSTFLEEESKDTMGEMFALKFVLQDQDCKNVAVICAEQHVPRAEYLWSKIIGTIPKYTFIGLQSKRHEELTTGDESRIMAEHQQIIDALIMLKRVNPAYDIYQHPYYQDQARQVSQLLAHNDMIRAIEPWLMPDIADQLLNHKE